MLACSDHATVITGGTPCRRYLVIGDHCLFGEGVSIHDENHRGGRGDLPVARRGFTTAPIFIGRNVWVGAKATILQGVTIGDNAIVGAHAVVTRDVPANMLALGVPARVARAGSQAE
jgi:acetyltransferase-like isoleucine patch superfamily enzyme